MLSTHAELKKTDMMRFVVASFCYLIMPVTFAIFKSAD